MSGTGIGVGVGGVAVAGVGVGGVGVAGVAVGGVGVCGVGVCGPCHFIPIFRYPGYPGQKLHTKYLVDVPSVDNVGGQNTRPLDKLIQKPVCFVQILSLIFIGVCATKLDYLTGPPKPHPPKGTANRSWYGYISFRI